MNDHRSNWKFSKRGLLFGAGIGALLIANIFGLKGLSVGKRQALELSFKGPFKYGQELPIENRQNAPVAIKKIAFADHDLGDFLLVEFSFNGKKEPGRKIDLSVLARDDSGRIIFRESVTCFDARIPPSSQILNEAGAAFSVNMRPISLNQISPVKIASLEMSFSE